MSSVKHFNPERDIQSLEGKVILITGGTAGLGKESLLLLVKRKPSHIFFTGRNAKAAEDVIKAARFAGFGPVPVPRITFLECDLASLCSVRAAAIAFVDQCSRLDILICNAGIMASPPGLTTDGYEVQFGTNHLGHALLTKLLLPTLLRTAAQPQTDVRIVNVTSTGFTVTPKGKGGIAFNDLETPCNWGIGSRWARYGQSKLANVLYAAELARIFPSILATSVHPGVVKTDLVKKRGFFDRLLIRVMNPKGLLSPKEGAYNQCWAAAGERKEIVSGTFYEPVGISGNTKTKYSESETLARELWDWTARELRGYEL